MSPLPALREHFDQNPLATPLVILAVHVRDNEKASCFLLVDVFQARGFLVVYVSSNPVLIFWAQVHMP